MDPLGVIAPVAISKKSFLVSLPKKQQDDMVQPLGHVRWSLKGRNPDYFMLFQFNSWKIGISKIGKLQGVQYISYRSNKTLIVFHAWDAEWGFYIHQ